MKELGSRRQFFVKCFSSGMQLFAIPFMICSCGSKDEKKKNATASSDPCNDLSELSEADIKKRESLGYVKKSPVPAKHCGNCNLWLPPTGTDECGICQLFKGPVPEQAYCTYWAPRV